MEFEWDERKAAANIEKHAVPFEYAVRVFLDPRRLDAEDRRRNYEEERRVTLGSIDGRLFVVAFAGSASGSFPPGNPITANGGDMIKHYRLDAKKPRKLTPAEARRLDAASIDYSDIPSLVSCPL